MTCQRPALRVVAGIVYAFLYAPIAAVVCSSVNASRHGTAWGGFTLEWYRGLAGNPSVWGAAWNTLALAAASTAIATVLGTALGYGLARHRVRGCGWLERMLQLPVFIPDVVMGAGFLLLYAALRAWLGGVSLGLGTMVLGHVTFQLPFVALVVRARLARLDPAFEEAAHDLGADVWQTFWRVTFPLMLPGVAAGALLAFTLSVDDFVVSFFTSGPGSTTLPILIYSSVKRGLSPEIHALASLIVVLSVVGTILVMWLRRRQD
jgi:spermidine/putrescine transport system permease protein